MNAFLVLPLPDFIYPIWDLPHFVARVVTSQSVATFKFSHPNFADLGASGTTLASV